MNALVRSVRRRLLHPPSSAGRWAWWCARPGHRGAQVAKEPVVGPFFCCLVCGKFWSERR